MVKCINNEAFEDQLSIGDIYRCVTLKGGSVRVLNNQGEFKWYGLLGKFEVVL